MDSLYNEAEFKPPPLNTLPPIGNIKAQDIGKIKLILQQSILFYQNQADFSHASALLSRLLARRKNSFKKLKGFKTCSKLNSALSRYLKINITMILDNFYNSLPESELFIDRLPMQSNYEYILLRLITTQKVHQRIKNCCEEAFKYFQQLLHDNFFLDILTLFISVLSTIWTASNIINNFTINLYNKLITYKNIFPISSKQTSLLSEFNFPTKLELIYDETKFEENEKKINITLNLNLNLKEPGKSVSINSEPERNNIIDLDTDRTKALNIEKPINSTIVDLGTLVNRTDDKKLNVMEIRSSPEIRNFFDMEDKKRKTDLRGTITHQIKNQEWILIKKSILNKINSNDNRTAMKLFRTLIINKINNFK